MDWFTDILGFVVGGDVYNASGSGRHIRVLTDAGHIQEQMSFVKIERCYTLDMKQIKLLKQQR